MVFFCVLLQKELGHDLSSTSLNSISTCLVSRIVNFGILNNLSKFLVVSKIHSWKFFVM